MPANVITLEATTAVVIIDEGKGGAVSCNIGLITLLVTEDWNLIN